MSLDDLEAAISAKRDQMLKRRDELLAEIDQIDQALEPLGGGGGARPGAAKKGGKTGPRGPRAKNSMTMKEAITAAIGKFKNGATLAEVTEGVKKQGYVSKAANFKNVVYQTLYTNADMFPKGDDGKYRVAS